MAPTMKTTEFFVELVIVGVGAMIAVVVALLAIVPDLMIIGVTLRWWAVMPLLAFTYLLGIIVDRVADGLFEMLFANKARSVSRNEWKNMRDRVLAESNEVHTRLYDYAMHRQRILRGWAVNALLMMIAFAVLLMQQGNVLRKPVLIPLTFGLLLLLAVVCTLIWKQMDNREVSTIERLYNRLPMEQSN